LRWVSESGGWLHGQHVAPTGVIEEGPPQYHVVLCLVANEADDVADQRDARLDERRLARVGARDRQGAQKNRNDDGSRKADQENERHVGENTRPRAI
jgi:hypothetical protein